MKAVDVVSNSSFYWQENKDLATVSELKCQNNDCTVSRDKGEAVIAVPLFLVLSKATCRLSTMLLVFLVVLGVTLATGEVTVTVSSHWQGGFQGRVCLPVEKEMHGWKIRLVFDQPVASLDVYTSDVVEKSENNQEYVLGNKAWNADEHAGDQVCVEFQGHTNGNISPAITAYFEGETGPHATSGPGVTSGPGATQGVTSAAPEVTFETPLGEGIVAPLKIINDWDSRFEGSFSFPVPNDIHGYMINVTFSSPVTKMDISNAEPLSPSSDNIHWTLVNKPTFADVPKGTFVLQFYGSRNEFSSKLTGQAVLVDLGRDNQIVTCPPNKAGSKYNYDCVLMESILFYEAQRSGKLPANNRIPWRGDSALHDGDGGVDLTGGWYDAGDHIKFNFPMAFSTTLLTWGLLEFKDTYQAADQLEWIYESVKWPLDYLLKCHVSADVYYVQVGDGGPDHSYWGRPEDMTMARPAYKVTASKPGCDVAMETAAAFSAASLAFKERDPTYSETLATHAKSLWQFAVDHQALYSSSVPEAAGFYRSYNFTDEMCWGSLWLYRLTGEEKYLTEAQKWFDPTPAWGLSWDEKIAGNQILMYNLTKDEAAKQAIIATFDLWFPGGDVPYTPKGLPWRLQWGSLRYASNMAAMALLAAEVGVNPEEYRHWAMCIIHYALGDTGRSFVVGFGVNPPQRPHHRSSSCPTAPAPCGSTMMSSSAPNPHTLYGAMVGGPDQSDGYSDRRDDYVSNEVACDYNAGFQTAVAGLRSLLLRKLHPEQTERSTCPYSKRK